MSLNVKVTANLDTSKVDMQFNKMMSRISGKQINFNVNGKSFTQPLGRITASANEFTKSLEASNARVIAFGASVGMINAVSNAFKALVAETIKFEKTLADINVILNASDSAVEKFGQSLFDVAKNTAQSFDKVADAALEFSRQGLTMEETLKRTNDALILTRLTSLNAEEAVAGLTAAVNAFGDAGLTTTDIIDKLAAVDVKFAVSSEDLINALERTGAVAIDAGVEIDNLIGLVTSLQQTTARGGSVIGNGLKTIFTRIQRPQSINQIEELGVAVRDLSGAILPADKILLNMAKSFDTMSQSQQSNVVQFSAGIFQANIFRSVLRDLAKDQNIFSKAAEVSANAAGEAATKNETLNKTLSALAAQSGVAIEQLAEAIGELAIKPEIGGLLSGFLSVVEGFKDALGGGDEEGNTFAKGFVRGFGNVLTGPALFAFGAVFIKMLANVSKFASQSLKDVLGITTKKDKIKQMEESIVDVLSRNKHIQEGLNDLEGDRLAQEKFLLKVIEAQTNAMEKQKSLASSLAGSLIKAGVRSDLTSRPGDLDGDGKIDSFNSQGLIPSYAANEERKGAIKGGYTPGAIRRTHIKGVGNVIYNTAEKVKKFQGMSQPAIMPPETSRAGKKYKNKFKDTHGFDPYASHGFVPNFASLSTNGTLNLEKAKLKLFATPDDLKKVVGKDFDFEIDKKYTTANFAASLEDIALSSGGSKDIGQNTLSDLFNDLAEIGVQKIERPFEVRNIGDAKKKTAGTKDLKDQAQISERKTLNLLRDEQGPEGKKHDTQYHQTFDDKNRSKGISNFPTDLVAYGDRNATHEVKSGRFSAANIISKSLRMSSDRDLHDFLRREYPELQGFKTHKDKVDKKSKALALKLNIADPNQGGKKPSDKDFEWTEDYMDQMGLNHGFVPNFSNGTVARKITKFSDSGPGDHMIGDQGQFFHDDEEAFKKTQSSKKGLEHLTGKSKREAKATEKKTSENKKQTIAAREVDIDEVEFASDGTIPFKKRTVNSKNSMHQEYLKQYAEGETKFKKGQTLFQFLSQFYDKKLLQELKKYPEDFVIKSKGFIPNYAKYNYVELADRIINYPGKLPLYEELAGELGVSKGVLQNLAGKSIFTAGTRKAFIKDHMEQAKPGRFGHGLTEEKAKEKLAIVSEKLRSTREKGYAQQAGLDFENALRKHFHPEIKKPPGQPHMDFPAGTLSGLDKSQMNDIFLNTSTGGDAFRGRKGHEPEHFIAKYLREKLDKGGKVFNFTSPLGADLLKFALQKDSGTLRVDNAEKFADIVGINLDGSDMPNEPVNASERLNTVLNRAKKLREAIAKKGKIRRGGQKKIEFDYEKDFVQSLSNGIIPNFGYMPIHKTKNGKDYVWERDLKIAKVQYPKAEFKQWDKNPKMYFVSGDMSRGPTQEEVEENILKFSNERRVKEFGRFAASKGYPQVYAAWQKGITSEKVTSGYGRNYDRAAGRTKQVLPKQLLIHQLKKISTGDISDIMLQDLYGSESFDNVGKDYSDAFVRKPSGKRVVTLGSSQIEAGTYKKGDLLPESGIGSISEGTVKALYKEFEMKYGASQGLIPNFANPLQAAIQRERGAGLPDSKIRIDQSNQLKSSKNPMGLAVINTRDEPGGVEQGIARARKMGIDPKRHGSASSGLIPNFADSPEDKATKKFANSMIELGQKLNELSNSIDTDNAELKNAFDELTNAFQSGAKQFGETGDKGGVKDIGQKSKEFRAALTKQSGDRVKKGESLNELSEVGNRLKEFEATLGGSQKIVQQEAEGRENGLQQLFYLQSAISMTNGFLEEFATSTDTFTRKLSQAGLAVSNVTAAYIQQREIIPEFMEMFNVKSNEAFSVGELFGKKDEARSAARELADQGPENVFTRGSRRLANRSGGGLNSILRFAGKAGKGLSFLTKGAARLLPVVGQLYTGFTAVNEAIKFFTGGEGIFDLMASEGSKAAKRLEELGKASEGAKNALESLKNQEEILRQISEIEAKGKNKSVADEQKLVDLKVKEIEANTKSISAFEAFNNETKVGEVGVKMYSSMLEKFGSTAKMTAEQLQEMMLNIKRTEGINTVVQQLQESMDASSGDEDDIRRAEQGGVNLGRMLAPIFDDVEGGFKNIQEELTKQLKGGRELGAIGDLLNLNADDLIEKLVGSSGLIDEQSKILLNDAIKMSYQVIEDTAGDLEGTRALLKGLQKAFKNKEVSDSVKAITTENINLKRTLKNRISQELKDIKIRKIINDANLKSLSLQNQEIKAREDLLKNYSLMSEGMAINRDADRKLAEAKRSAALGQQDAIDTFRTSILGESGKLLNSGNLGANFRLDNQATEETVRQMQRDFNNALDAVPGKLEEAFQSINQRLPESQRVDARALAPDVSGVVSSAKLQEGNLGDKGAAQQAFNQIFENMQSLDPVAQLATFVALQEVGILDKSEDVQNKLAELSSVFQQAILKGNLSLKHEIEKAEQARKQAHIQARTLEGVKYLRDQIEGQGDVNTTIKETLLGQVGHLDIINKNLKDRADAEIKFNQLYLAAQAKILENKLKEANKSGRSDLAQSSISAVAMSGPQTEGQLQAIREDLIEKNLIKVNADVSSASLALDESRLRNDFMIATGKLAQAQKIKVAQEEENSRLALLEAQLREKALQEGNIRYNTSLNTLATEIVTKDSSLKETQLRNKILDSTGLRLLISDQKNEEELEQLRTANKDSDLALRRLVTSGQIEEMGQEMLRQQELSLTRDALLAASKARLVGLGTEQERKMKKANELLSVSNKIQELGNSIDKAKMDEARLRVFTNADVDTDRNNKRFEARQAANRASITGRPEDVLAYANAMKDLNSSFRDGASAMDAVRVKMAEIDVAAKNLGSDLVNITADSTKSNIKQIFKDIGSGEDPNEAMLKAGLNIAQDITDRIVDHNIDQMMKNLTAAFTGVDPEMEAKDMSRKIMENTGNSLSTLEDLKGVLEQVRKELMESLRNAPDEDISSLRENIEKLGTKIEQESKETITSIRAETTATQNLINFYESEYQDKTSEGVKLGLIAAQGAITAAVKQGVTDANSKSGEANRINEIKNKAQQKEAKQRIQVATQQKKEAETAIQQQQKIIQQKQTEQQSLTASLGTRASDPENIIRGAYTGQGYEGLNLEQDVIRNIPETGGERLTGGAGDLYSHIGSGQTEGPRINVDALRSNLSKITSAQGIDTDQFINDNFESKVGGMRMSGSYPYPGMPNPVSLTPDLMKPSFLEGQSVQDVGIQAPEEKFVQDEDGKFASAETIEKLEAIRQAIEESKEIIQKNEEKKLKAEQNIGQSKKQLAESGGGDLNTSISNLDQSSTKLTTSIDSMVYAQEALVRNTAELQTLFRQSLEAEIKQLDAIERNIEAEDRSTEAALLLGDTVMQNIDATRMNTEQLTGLTNNAIPSLSAEMANLASTIASVCPQCAGGGGMFFGGKVQAFAKGGLVKGANGEDQVPAMLTAGEYVVPKKDVASMLSAVKEQYGFNKGGEVQMDPVAVNQQQEKEQKMSAGERLSRGTMGIAQAATMAAVTSYMQDKIRGDGQESEPPKFDGNKLKNLAGIGDSTVNIGRGDKRLSSRFIANDKNIAEYGEHLLAKHDYSVQQRNKKVAKKLGYARQAVGMVMNLASSTVLNKGSELFKEYVGPYIQKAKKAVMNKVAETPAGYLMPSGAMYKHAKGDSPGMSYTSFRAAEEAGKKTDLYQKHNILPINGKVYNLNKGQSSSFIPHEANAAFVDYQNQFSKLEAQTRDAGKQGTKGFNFGGSVPAMLTAGESIIPAKQARSIGYSNLNIINKTGTLPTVQGPGGIDNVGPVALTPGDFVIRKSSTQKLNNNPNLMRMSAANPGMYRKGGEVLRGYYNGGVVEPGASQVSIPNRVKEQNTSSIYADAPMDQTSPMGSSSSASKSGDVTNNININISIDKAGSESQEVTADAEGSYEQEKELSMKIKAAVLEVIRREKRVGGELS